MNTKLQKPITAGKVTPLEIVVETPAEVGSASSSELARLVDESARTEAAEQQRRREEEIARQAREARRQPLGQD